MNTFVNCNSQIDVSCSFLDLVKCRAEIFVDGFMIFLICCIPFDEVQTLSLFRWNDSNPTSSTLGKKFKVYFWVMFILVVLQFGKGF